MANRSGLKIGSCRRSQVRLLLLVSNISLVQYLPFHLVTGSVLLSHPDHR